MKMPRNQLLYRPQIKIIGNVPNIMLDFSWNHYVTSKLYNSTIITAVVIKMPGKGYNVSIF